jgi:hypothetical protein
MSGAISGLFGGFASAAGDLFSAQGAFAEAKTLDQASSLEDENAKIAKESGAIQLTQQQRQAYKVVGAGQADVAGSGLAASGSALDVMRASASQASLAGQLIGTQTAINVNAYEAQAGAYRGEAQAANALGHADGGKAAGDLIGGIFKGFGF